MKTFFLCFTAALILSSCDPNADKQVGNPRSTTTSSTGGGSVGTGGGAGTDSNSPTDAPLDGGLGVLLVAGAAYGVNRMRKQKSARQ